MSLLWVFVGILSVIHSRIGENNGERIFSPGDIIIGGLFPIHLKACRDKDTGELTCSDFDFNSVLQYETMIYAIEKINRERLLHNVTIGYDIYDTCGHVSLAIKATLQMVYGLSSMSDHQRFLSPETTQSGIDEPRVKVVIGESSSDVSVTVSHILAVTSTAQISYASTSELLNQKHKFPTFLRTVSSDAHQTDGMVELVKKFNWKTVAIVGSVGAYGKYGSDRLSAKLPKNICLEFFKILPGDFNLNQSATHKLLDDLMGQISKSSAEAIIMFTKATNVEIIMEAAIKIKLNRTWVASDAWSTSTKIATMPGIELAGQVFGFTFFRKEVQGFKEFIMSISNGKQNATGTNHTSQYPICRNQTGERRGGHCRLTNNRDGSEQCLDQQCLMNFIDNNSSYSLYIAVQVIADSLSRLMRCDSERCERTSNFTALELFKEIQKTSFTLDDLQVSFNKEGNANLSYDIVYWNQSLRDSNVPYETIGKYWPGGKIEVPKDLEKAMKAVQVSIYNCSKTCAPGQELKFEEIGSCCARCVPCGKGEFSTGNGSKCEHCSEHKFSVEGERDQCYPITEDFLHWSSPFSISLCCFAAFGSIVTVVFGILFAVNRNTPIVRAVGGNLCFLELLSLQVCFVIIFFFLGRPAENSCRLRLPSFGFASSLCISCILANMLQILVGFDFNMKMGAWMKKLSRPVSVVIVVSGVQLVLSVSWVIFEPSSLHEKEFKMKTVHLCQLQSIAFFAAMIAYNAFLALICFLLAFKGKELPDLYKNAALISVSMVLFLIIWLIFFPLFLTLESKVKPGVESASILIFTYSILCCHFAPKCYIMVFKKELNNEKAIIEYIRKHYERQGKPVVTS